MQYTRFEILSILSVYVGLSANISHEKYTIIM